MRDLTLDDELVPKFARKLVKLAKANTWIVGVTYSEFLGKAGEDRYSIAVRMRRFGVSAWAVWLDTGFDAAASSSPLAAMGYRELLTFIQQPQQTGTLQ